MTLSYNIINENLLVLLSIYHKIYELLGLLFGWVGGWGGSYVVWAYLIVVSYNLVYLFSNFVENADNKWLVGIMNI
jgi:hypothetical protein